MTKTLIVLAFAGASFSHIAAAQNASLLGAGTRVRIVAPVLDSTQQIGKVVSATADTIVFRADANPVSRSLAIADLSSIEVYAGKQTHRGRDALYGLAAGSAVGAIAGASAKPDPNPCYAICGPTTRQGNAIFGAILGGLTGSLVGAYIVGSFDKSDLWLPLRKIADLRVSPSASGVAMSLRF